jgi:hypothetical protein
VIESALDTFPCVYPVLASLRPEKLQGAVANQLGVMATYHEMYDDFARRTLAFFEANR